MSSRALQVSLCGPLCLALLLVVACSFEKGALEAIDCREDASVCGPEAVCGAHGYCVVATDLVLGDTPEPPAPLCGAVQCLPSQTCCEAQCVELASDPAHCGACGTVCGPGMYCAAGTCACAAQQGDCDGDPSNGCEVDLGGDDAAHCGACGAACPVHMLCAFGSCVCAPGQLDCNAAAEGCETAILSDPQSCGGCPEAGGELCAMDQTCNDGRCGCGASRCAPTETCCEGDLCVDLERSPFHCGACGNRCRPGEVCEAGQCRCQPLVGAETTCGAGERCCDLGCTTASVCTCNLVPCAADETCCEDGCTLLGTTTDCATCGDACTGDEQCLEGVCKCPDGGTLCGSSCIDTDTDPDHCGGCDVRCAPSESCCNGACVDTDVSVEQCGGCVASGAGTRCAEGQGCCAGECRNLRAPGRCGSCETDCTTLPRVNEVDCSAEGACAIISCDAGRGDCDGDPSNGCEVDLSDTPEHCGACGVDCNGACSDGLCLCDDNTCAPGATCDGDTCRCAGSGDECRRTRGDHCEGTACRCGDEPVCTGEDRRCGTDGCYTDD